MNRFEGRFLLGPNKGNWCSSGFWKGDIHRVNRIHRSPFGPLDKTSRSRVPALECDGNHALPRGLRISQEHGAIPITGEPFVWALALPVVGAVILADIVWGGLLLRYRQLKRGLWWLITGGLWGIALWLDFAHH
jgi:hypothetical protein